MSAGKPAVDRYRVNPDRYHFVTKRGKVVATANRVGGTGSAGPWEWYLLSQLRWRHEVPDRRLGGTEATLAQVQAVVHGICRIYVPL